MKKSKPSSFVPFELLSESSSLLWSPETREIPSEGKDAISLVLSELVAPQSTGPILDITDGHGQLALFALQKILALMWFPKDEGSRNKFLAAEKIRAYAAVEKDRRAGTLPIPDEIKPFEKRIPKMLENYLKEWLAPHGGISALIEDPPLTNPWGISAKKKASDGLLTGALLHEAVAIAQAGIPTSISKSVFILSKQKSERASRKAWAEYKSTAHFWAAACSLSRDDFPPNFPLTPEELPDFLAVSELFRRAGLTTFSHGQAGSILDPVTTWQFPADLSLPDISLTWTGHSLQKIKADLKKYAAPRRSY